MKYGKSLIVLSGDYGKKALTVETTALGSTGVTALNSKTERLYLAVKQGENRFVTLLTGEKIRFPFVIDQTAHFIVVRASDKSIALYGTNNVTRLWQGNMLDGVGKTIDDMENRFVPFKTKTAAKKAEKTPKTVERYDDEQLAKTNYYPKKFSFITGGAMKSFYKTENRTTLSTLTRDFLVTYGSAESLSAPAATKTVSALIRRHLQTEPLFIKVAQSQNRRLVFTNGKTEQPIKPLVCPQKLTAQSQKSVRSAIAFSQGKPEKISSAPVNFYEQIRTKIDKLFGEAQPFIQIEKILPNTRWVRVDYEQNKYYAVGLIGDKPDFICYGVPAKYSTEPPADLEKSARWLPFSPDKPQGDGMWLMYQDAKTGQSVKL